MIIHTSYQFKRNRKVGSLEFLENSVTPGRPFYNVLVVAKMDRCLKRLKMEIFPENRVEKLAFCYGMSIGTSVPFN